MNSEVVQIGLGLAVVLLELASAVTIVVGAAFAVRRVAWRRDVTQARHTLSHALLLALDFAIGADILKVAMTPELATVLVVGGIVAIRIALTLVIVWELRQGSAPPLRTH
jgi:uncharacterized membrane protein